MFLQEEIPQSAVIVPVPEQAVGGNGEQALGLAAAHMTVARICQRGDKKKTCLGDRKSGTEDSGGKCRPSLRWRDRQETTLVSYCWNLEGSFGLPCHWNVRAKNDLPKCTLGLHVSKSFRVILFATSQVSGKMWKGGKPEGEEA